MFTSYFGNLKNVRNPLSISGKAPAFYTQRGLPEYKILAPKYSFFKAYKDGLIGEEGYTEEYCRLVLDPLDPRAVYEHLTGTYGDDVTLLCYEKPGDFCHRRIVAVWLELALGIEIPELPR